MRLPLREGTVQVGEKDQCLRGESLLFNVLEYGCEIRAAAAHRRECHRFTTGLDIAAVDEGVEVEQVDLLRPVLFNQGIDLACELAQLAFVD